MPSEETPLALLLAPDGEDAEVEFVGLAGGADLDEHAAGHRREAGADEREFALLVIEALVDGRAGGEGRNERSLGVNFAVGVGVVEIVGQDGAEPGGIAGFRGGQARIVGGSEGGAETFPLVGEGGRGGFFGGERGQGEREGEEGEERERFLFHGEGRQGWGRTKDEDARGVGLLFRRTRGREILAGLPGD